VGCGRGGLGGSDGVVDLAEPVDFDGEGVAVVDGSAVEVLVLEGAEEPLDDAVGSWSADKRGLLTRVRT
jgi:hypothetical protein